jgi:hypothetical protein
MKLTMVLTLLLGFLMPLHAQQQLCFSNNCPQTPATIFQPNRNSTHVLFPSSLGPPIYRPVDTLTLSPATRQLFLRRAPATDTLSPFRLPSASGPSEKFPAISGIPPLRAAQGGNNVSHNPGLTFPTTQGAREFSIMGPRP